MRQEEAGLLDVCTCATLIEVVNKKVFFDILRAAREQQSACLAVVPLEATVPPDVTLN
ncbi:MAG: hypothetical protein OXC53_05005 [Rhodobacteraceae bacterium]|nr:hypothetical protein [Paracoccaceae bacterium]